jgi:RHS repeat-associated protein
MGGTAWWAARSKVDADYKTIRYSGKERDATGLVYYGLRYLAPWLGRWINPDPLGVVDGLNVYRMVGNNPINMIDDQGGMRGPADTAIPIQPESTRSTLDNVSEKAQHSLREQVLEVESLVGITWDTMEMLEKIQNLRTGIDLPSAPPGSVPDVDFQFGNASDASGSSSPPLRKRAPSASRQ